MAIILLDGIVAMAATLRRALVGRGDGSRLAQVALTASLGVLLATAYSIVTVLTSERLTPGAVEPGPDVPATGAPATGTPVEQPEPTTVAPRTSGHSAAMGAPPAGRPAVVPSASPSAPTAAPPPVPTPLRADFAVEKTALLSYGTAVTITNPGTAAVTNWALVIVLPRESLEVSSVTGARASRAGARWTFVPDGSTGRVPGRGSVRVTFRVNGAAISAAPTACTIDGTACTGLPG